MNMQKKEQFCLMEGMCYFSHVPHGPVANEYNYCKLPLKALDGLMQFFKGFWMGL